MKYLAVSFIFIGVCLALPKTLGVRACYFDGDGIIVINVYGLNKLLLFKLRVYTEKGFYVTFNDKKLVKNKRKNAGDFSKKKKLSAKEVLSFLKIKKLNVFFSASMGEPSASVLFCSMLANGLYTVLRSGDNTGKIKNCLISFCPVFTEKCFCINVDADISLSFKSFFKLIKKECV